MRKTPVGQSFERLATGLVALPVRNRRGMKPWDQTAAFQRYLTTNRSTRLAARKRLIDNSDDIMIEPRRVCRRLIDLSYAAMGSVSRAA